MFKSEIFKSYANIHERRKARYISNFFPGECLKYVTHEDIVKACYLVDMIGTSNLQKKLKCKQKMSIL